MGPVPVQNQSFGHTEVKLLHILSVHTGEQLKELWLLLEIKREDDHVQSPHVLRCLGLLPDHNGPSEQKAKGLDTSTGHKRCKDKKLNKKQKNTQGA